MPPSPTARSPDPSLLAPAVAHGDQQIDDQPLEESRRHLPNAFEEVVFKSRAQRFEACVNLLFRSLCSQDRRQQVSGPLAGSSSAPLAPLDIAGSAPRSACRPGGLFRQYLATHVSDPIDAPTDPLEQPGSLEVDGRPRDSVGKGRRLPLGSISARSVSVSRRLGSDPARAARPQRCRRPPPRATPAALGSGSPEPPLRHGPKTGLRTSLICD